MTAAITGDGSITYSKDSSQVIRKADGRYSVIVSPLHQEIDDWQSSAELSIGGCLLRIPLIGLENQRQRALVR